MKKFHQKWKKVHRFWKKVYQFEKVHSFLKNSHKIKKFFKFDKKNSQNFQKIIALSKKMLMHSKRKKTNVKKLKENEQ